MFNLLNLKDIGELRNTDARLENSMKVRDQGYEEVDTYAIESNHCSFVPFLMPKTFFLRIFYPAIQ